MFELFMYVNSCNALLARFFAVDRALNSYFMIMIMKTVGGKIIRTLKTSNTVDTARHQRKRLTKEYLEQLQVVVVV